jgi:DNA topoisomerase-2
MEYEKLGEVEHVIKRSGMYIGSLEVSSKEVYGYDPMNDIVTYGKLNISTSLLKMFDELLVNACDNKVRDKNMTYIKMFIEDYRITLINDGESIPVEINKQTGLYNPQLIFTNLRTSSTYNDESRTGGGMNGIGAKLTNIFSTEFIIDIVNKGIRYYQVVKNNNSDISEPTIYECDSDNYTSISFIPDFEKLSLNELVFNSTLSLIYKRLFDVTGLFPDLNVSINDVVLPKLNFINYARKYFDGVKLVEYKTENWNLVLGAGAFKKFIQISFVNSIHTSKGGEHVKYIMKQITNYIIEHMKKYKINVTKADVTKQCCVFLNCTIINPVFDTQTKDELVSSPAKFGSTCNLPESFLSNFIKITGIAELLKKKSASKLNVGISRGRISVEDLDDANLAGSNRSDSCTLFLCEGKSAKSMVLKGMGIIGRDYYGVYPLRGKILNTRDVSDTKYSENMVVTNIRKILGLMTGIEYTDTKSLRYGHIVCVKDADDDGAHIMGLILNFLNSKFPSLLDIPGFFSEFITPMIKVRSGNELHEFYNDIEYENFIKTVTSKVTVEFIKGLATNEDDDTLRYFKNYKNNKIEIVNDAYADGWLDLAFNQKRANERKTWLEQRDKTNYLPRTAGGSIMISDFINADLIKYAYEDCKRSIPSMIDGFKPSQRKILFGMLDSVTKPIKIYRISGKIAEVAQYHHGDASLNGTIIGMAQDFVGSNNLPLLEQHGQFGTRVELGDDAGAPRYISSCISKVARLIFPKEDDPILEYVTEDNCSAEPKYYFPIIPMILVNGAKGIGVGWSVEIPNYNPKDIIEYVRSMLNGTKEPELSPWYKGFKGQILKTPTGWKFLGILEDHGSYVELKELPIGISTSSVTNALSSYLADKKKIISNFTIETCPVNEIDIKIFTFTKEDRQFLPKILKLSKTISNTGMVLFDFDENIKQYDSVKTIINEWFVARYEAYERRITYNINKMEHDALILANKVRFLSEIMDETINIYKKSNECINEILTDNEYDKIDNEYKYLLTMHIDSITKEKYDALCAQLNKLNTSIDEYKTITVEQIWNNELDSLSEYLN